MAKEICINGVDFTEMFKEKGYSVGEKKILGNNGGVTLAGTQIEDVIAIKDTIDLPIECLSETDLSTLMSNLRNSPMAPYVELYYFSVNYNKYRSVICIRDEVTNVHRFTSNKGVDYYKENTLSFVEQ